MLVEGGYLDSMKRLLEKAAETPSPPEPRSKKVADQVRAGRISRSLKKLATILTGPSRRV